MAPQMQGEKDEELPVVTARGLGVACPVTRSLSGQPRCGGLRILCDITVTFPEALLLTLGLESALNQPYRCQHRQYCFPYRFNSVLHISGLLSLRMRILVILSQHSIISFFISVFIIKGKRLLGLLLGTYSG